MTPKKKHSNASVIRIEENVVQEAINQTGFGWFNMKIFMVSSMIYMNIGFGFGNIGLVIPSAACDFEMQTIEKNRIAVSPLLGMLCSPYFWATIAEVYGRRPSLMISLCIHFLSEVSASVVSNYWGFLICKFINGFSLGAQLSLLFTYLGEFQPSEYKDKMFSWIELPYCFGLIIIAGLGWVIIPLDFRYTSTIVNFSFNPWNLYLFICGLPALMLCFCVTSLPETPKYLAESGQHDKLVNVLYKIFHENTKLSKEDYIDRLKLLQNPAIDELLVRAKQAKDYRSNQSLLQKFQNFIQQTKNILKPPYLKTTILVCITIYCITYAYLTMMFWLPEIFRRFADFDETFPNRPASICIVSDLLYSSNATNQTIIEDCSSDLDTSVYLHNIILGLACVPVSVWFPLFVEKLGYKIHFLAASVVSCALVIGLLFVKNSVQNLILFSIFEAMTSLCITIILCTLVELYPTHLRVIAAAFATFMSRIGAVIGISGVGYLIDNYCRPLLLLVGVHLAVAAIFGYFVPMQTTKERKEVLEISTPPNLADIEIIYRL